ncbi:MAG: hypothetical protein GF308_22120 [Candidatus Heimdallarchaeota archaeon]|nr:hypothetical protein [Candidatus Heimdallarchaeota archaeon]
MKKKNRRFLLLGILIASLVPSLFIFIPNLFSESQRLYGIPQTTTITITNFSDFSQINDAPYIDSDKGFPEPNTLEFQYGGYGEEGYALEQYELTLGEDCFDFELEMELYYTYEGIRLGFGGFCELLSSYSEGGNYSTTGSWTTISNMELVDNWDDKDGYFQMEFYPSSGQFIRYNTSHGTLGTYGFVTYKLSRVNGVLNCTIEKRESEEGPIVITISKTRASGASRPINYLRLGVQIYQVKCSQATVKYSSINGTFSTTNPTTITTSPITTTPPDTTSPPITTTPPDTTSPITTSPPSTTEQPTNSSITKLTTNFFGYTGMIGIMCIACLTIVLVIIQRRRK